MEIEIKGYGVYVYLHLVNGVPIYVGMGKMDRVFNIENRRTHWREATKNGYTVKIVSWHANRQEALEKERSLIKQYKPMCNLAFNGFVHPNLRGNTWNIGRKHTAEAKRIMSEKQKISWQKTKRSTGTRKPKHPIKCLDTGEIFESMGNAARKTGVCLSGISQCVNGHHKMAGGLKFVRFEG